MTVDLFDISFWQDDNSTAQMVNFTTAMNAGIKGALIKVSQATYLDSDYILNWQHAKDAHMPRGGFHFLDWTKPAIDQANFFCGALKNDPGELPPTIDFECRGGVPSNSVTRQSLHDFILTTERELPFYSMGRKLLLYTGLDYWHLYGSADPWWAQHCDLWFAYPTTAAQPPPPPLPWTSWKIWQWNWQGNGPKYGCESLGVDLDRFNGTLAEYYAYIGTTPPVQKTINSRGMLINIRNAPRIELATDVGDAMLIRADVIEELTDWYIFKAYAAKSVTTRNP